MTYQPFIWIDQWHDDEHQNIINFCVPVQSPVPGSLMLCAVYLHLQDGSTWPKSSNELRSECQTPEKMCQAHYRCCHCNCGLHGMFCSSTTEDADGSITVECLHGLGCRVFAVTDAAPASAYVIELQDSNNNKDDNENERSVLSPTAENSTLTTASNLKTATPSTTPMATSTMTRFTCIYSNSCL